MDTIQQKKRQTQESSTLTLAHYSMKEKLNQ